MTTPERLKFRKTGASNSERYDADIFIDGKRVGEANVWVEETEAPSLSLTTGEFVWCWSITVGGEMVNCGTHENPEDAVKAAQGTWAKKLEADKGTYAATEKDLLQGIDWDSQRTMSEANPKGSPDFLGDA